MTPELISLLGQLPLVGIFVAFVLATRSDDRKERSSRDAEWREFIRLQNESLTATLNRLCSSFDEHDAKMQSNLEIIKERTAPQPYSRK